MPSLRGRSILQVIEVLLLRNVEMWIERLRCMTTSYLTYERHKAKETKELTYSLDHKYIF